MGITNPLFGSGGLQIRPNQRDKLELHKLGNCSCAIGITYIDEINAIDQLADVELGLASFALCFAHFTARHVENADLGIAFKHK